MKGLFYEILGLPTPVVKVTRKRLKRLRYTMTGFIPHHDGHHSQRHRITTFTSPEKENKRRREVNENVFVPYFPRGTSRVPLKITLS